MAPSCGYIYKPCKLYEMFFFHLVSRVLTHGVFHQCVQTYFVSRSAYMPCSVVSEECLLICMHHCPRHHNIQDSICKSRLLYSIKAVSLFTFLRILLSIPTRLLTFLLICPMCSLELKVSSSHSARYLKVDTLSIYGWSNST